ncbi:hypothetical protein [Vreelandella venusta]|uniref:hypothetical protein n=1 Tax=Vreelandella venusta TaxID=44935 RepID=UPI0018DA7BE2|nr:hypothetical protein [Halomonas venusta]QPI62448.1 hypothetical protein IR195_11115 [Halomonas venusta]
MIDAILYIADTTALNDDNPMPQGAVKTSDGKALIYYRGKTLPDDSRLTVLASDTYTGTGTAQRLFEAIENDADKLSLYTSVHDLTPRTVTDEEGNETTITPPFAFGMLAESALPVPATITARQARLVLAKNGLLSEVERAIGDIVDAEDRQIAGIEWEYAAFLEREAPWLTHMAEQLGMSDSDVDTMFIQGSTL